jgi:hypothetical protein
MFDCCIAKVLWAKLNNLLGWSVGYNFESIACLWLSQLLKCCNKLNALFVKK